MAKIFPLSNSINLSKKSFKYDKVDIGNFSDGEIFVRLKESVRGKRVIFVNSLIDSESIIETCIAADAAKRANAKEVTALIPYLGYMRQDRKDSARSSISSRVIIQMLEGSGIDNFIVLDLHANQIEGFFGTPVTHIEGYNIFLPFIRKRFKDLSDFIIVSPDVGGAKRAKKIASKLDLPLAIINKEREMANIVSSMELMGDVTNKNVIIFDDIVDTGGSLVKATELLLNNGANKVYGCITHGVLSGNAYQKINDSKLEKLFISDSVEIPKYKMINEELVKKPKQIETVTSSNVFEMVLKTIKNKGSINKIFNQN